MIDVFIFFLLIGIVVMFIRCEKCPKCGYLRGSSDNYCPTCGIPFKG